MVNPIRMRTKVAEMTALAATAVASEVDLTGMVTAVLDQTLAILGAQSAHVYLTEEDRVLRLAGQRNLPDDLVERLVQVPFHAPFLAARAAATRRVHAIEDTTTLDPNLTIARELVARTGSGSIVSLPLLTHGRLMGVLTFTLPRPQRFEPEELAALTTLAEIFAVGLANARLYDRERTLARQLQAVSDATLAISSEFDLPTVLQRIVDEARTVAGAEYAALGVGTDPVRPFAPLVYSGLTTDQVAAIGGTCRPYGLRGLVAREGRALRVADVHRHAEFAGLPPGHFEVTGFLGVPIRYRGRSMGSLYLANKVDGNEFTEMDQRAVEALAQHAGLALEHARIHDQMASEIAERRRSEEALRASEESLARAQHVARMGNWDWDAVTNDLRLSNEVYRIFGVVPQQFGATYDAFLSFIHSDDVEPVRQAVDEALSEGKPYSIDHRIVRKDGVERVVHEQAEVVRDAAGQPVRIFGTIQDITERTQAKEERERLLVQLDAERTWLRTVIEHSPAGILIIEGADGGRVSANPRAEELFGHPIVPALGVAQYMGEVCRPDGGPLSWEGLASERALRGQVISMEEQLLRRPDGREVPVVVSGGPIQDGQGNITGAIIIFEDITSRKELERLREEWVSVVAHDLRQPLAVVTGYASLVGRRAAGQDPMLKTAAQHILASAHQLNRMIADLMDASRIEARRLELRRESVELSSLLRDVVERTSEAARGIPVRLEIATPLPRLEADAGRLEQILGNLLSNATKYGYPDTEIRIAVESQAGEVQVSVINDGDGITPDEMVRLFTRFQRAHRTQEDRVKGIGLGLYITKGLVEAHGGRVWVESVPGQTTAFHFTLPLPAATAAV